MTTDAYSTQRVLKTGHPSELTDESIQRVIARVEDLAQANRHQLDDRARIRDLMDGGLAGMSRLVGKDLTKSPADLPVANQLLIANNRLAQKLGMRPDIKVDPPATNDSGRARSNADKRTRVLEGFDDYAKMELQLPQISRWLPGYGFGVWTIKQQFKHGDPYPHASLRDPFNAFPGAFGLDQEPFDIAFSYKISPEKLIRMYPQHKAKLEQLVNGGSNYGGGMNGRATVGAGTNSTGPSWSDQSSNGVDVYEYINRDGTWWILPACTLLLAYVPNPLKSGPAFVAPKRFSFSSIRGQYDHAIGLMSAIARLNVLSIMAAEDSVFGEVNIIGEMQGGTYQRGRKAVNKLRPGSQVNYRQDQMNFGMFQQIDRMEGQLRAQASYPVQDDGRSPMSFVTGRGMDSLAGAVDLEVTEYQTVLRHALQDIDAKRLEWVDELYPNRSLKISGMHKGSPFSESYKPSTHVAGHYASRRVYGIMAGFDEPNKLIGGFNLLQARIIDRTTFREQVHGLENHTKIAERVRDEQIEEGLFAGLGARAEQGDAPALNAMIALLPEGDMKKLLTDAYLKPLEEQAAMAEEQGGQPQGPPPDVQSLLASLGGGGMPGGPPPGGPGGGLPPGMM